MIELLETSLTALSDLPGGVWLGACAFLLPLPFGFFFRPRPGVSADASKVRRLRASLIVSALAMTALHLGYFAYRGSLLPPVAAGTFMPGPVMFFVWQPWLLLVMLGRALGGKTETTFPGSRRRGASLRPRAKVSPVGLRAWLPGWLAWAGVGLWLLASGGGLGGQRHVAWLLLASTALLWSLAPSLVRRSIEETPEPYPPGREEALAPAYRRHRFRNAWMAFRIFTIAGLGKLLLALALAHGADLRTPAVLWAYAIGLGVYLLLETVFYALRRRQLTALQRQRFALSSTEAGSPHTSSGGAGAPRR